MKLSLTKICFCINTIVAESVGRRFRGRHTRNPDFWNSSSCVDVAPNTSLYNNQCSYGMMPIDGAFNSHAGEDLLLSIASINTDDDAIRRRNVLVRQYVSLVEHIRKIAYIEDKDRHMERGFSDMHSTIRRKLERGIYDIFTKCIYLIDDSDYYNYKNHFEMRNYVECFYLIYSCVRECRIVSDYILAVNDVCTRLNAGSALYNTDIYRSGMKHIQRCKFNLSTASSICTADFLLNPVAILDLDLLDRIKLIHFFIKSYYDNVRCYGNRQIVEDFIRVYRSLYLGGSKFDHQVAAFVIYNLFAKLKFGNPNPSLISDMTRWMRGYINKEHDQAKFFCKLAFGFISK